MDEKWDYQWDHDHESFTKRRNLIRKRGTVGGPVTCVSLPKAKNVCVYSQGSGLERVMWSIRGKNRGKKRQDRIIVFDNGTAVHGIRYSSRSSNANNNLPDHHFTAVFGGRQVAVLRHVVPNFTSADEKEEISPMHIVPLQISASSKENHCINCSDWIWDVQWIPRATGWHLLIGLAHNMVELWSLSVAPTINKNDLTVQSLKASRVQTWMGAKRCLLYCLDFSCMSATTVNIAVGTAMQDIRVWRVCVSYDTTTLAPEDRPHGTMVAEEACLLGHQGVIHSVKWVPLANAAAAALQQRSPQLVSASDDRSVRLWGRQNEEQEGNNWQCLWVGWGHSARIWGLGIVRQRQANVIVSTGEDGTARLWNSQTGTELAIFRGHPCQCIWSVGTNSESGMIVTGGNDGTVALHEVGSISSAVDINEEGKNEPDRPRLDERLSSILLIPEDRTKVLPSGVDEAASGARPLDMNSASTAEPKKKKNKKKQPVGQVVVGMNFYGADCLLVATRGGSLFSVNTTTAVAESDWISLGSWALPLSDGADENDATVDPAGGCCLACHHDSAEKKNLWVAVGTSQGSIAIMTVPKVENTLYIERRVVISAPKQYRSVQGLAWLPSSKIERTGESPSLSLLSFHINVVLWWSVPAFAASNSSGPLWALEMGTQAIPICFAYDEYHCRLYIGDTRGNLTMLHLNGDNEKIQDNANQTYRTVAPSCTLTRLHQKEHVTDIVVVSTAGEDQLSTSHKRILSVGNDGCIAESFFNPKNGTLRAGLSVSASSALTGIGQLWVAPGYTLRAQEENVIVSGYYGNTFVILNVTHGYEIFRVDTGGRQRQLVFYAPFLLGKVLQPTMVESLLNLAVNVHRKQDGRNEIVLHLKRLNPVASKSESETYDLWHQHQYALGVNLHGETIYSASFFPYSSKEGPKSFALLTGSEDCGSKISLFENDVLVATKRLPPQESCVRAVCSSTCLTGSSNSTLLAVGGGKLTLQFFLATKRGGGEVEEHTRDVQVVSLGHGRTYAKDSIDHRINSVRSFSLDSPTGEITDDHVVAAGDSQGNCHIYRVTADEEAKRRSWMGLPLPIEAATRRPILSCEMVRMRSRLLLLTGTTGGDIHLFDLPAMTDAEEWNTLLPKAHHEGVVTFPATRIGTYHAHQMGVNSISAFLLMDDSSNRILVCSGGDDQAISRCELQVDFAADNTQMKAATVLELKTFREASSSAIKEVRMLDERHILSVGYSQRLALWKNTEEKELQLLWTAPASIGDINCLACTRPTEQNGYKSVVAVCGAGVDLFSVGLEEKQSK